MGKRVVAVTVVVASACTALHYSTTEQHAVVVSNNPYTFYGSGTQRFVISTAGSSDHDVLQAITPINCNSQWTLDTSIDPQQPAAGAHVCGALNTSTIGDGTVPCPRSYQFEVRYAGTQQGSFNCNINVNTWMYGGGTYGGITLQLTGSGSGSSGITVSPSQVDFKDKQILTQSTSQEVTVKNNGSAAVTVNGAINGAAFGVSPSVASFGLGSGSSATFNVTCTPPALGPHTGVLSFVAGTSSGSASLTCKGIDSPVTLSPDAVNFDRTLVGRPPAKKTVTLTGSGAEVIESVSLDATAVAAGVTIVDNPQGDMIGSGAAIVLAYSAAAMHPGGSLGTLSVKVDIDANPRSVAINGQALLGDVGTNPGGVEFGAVCVGDMVTKDVEVYASEAGDVQLLQLMQPAAPFSAMVVDTLPKTLGGDHTGVSATVRATLTPTEPGDLEATLELASDAPMKGTTEVELHGVGIAGGVAATPNTVHFGTALAGTTTSINEVQLTNCGTSSLAFERVYIEGDDARDFTLIGANPSRMLEPNESETFMVVMQPKSNGFKTARLVAQHADGIAVAALDGTGEGADEKQRETYYACSAGRASALWPLGLALLALRRRRSRRLDA